MQKKVILIIIAVVAALALIITGTILLLKSTFVSKLKGDSNNAGSVTSGEVAAENGGGSAKDSNKQNASDGNGSGGNSNGGDASSPSSVSGASQSGNITTFTVGNVSGKKGDKIKVPVELSSNQGFMGCLANFKYDTSALKYTGYKRSSLLKDYEVIEENGTIKFMTVEDKDVTANGTVIYLEFEIVSSKAQVSNIEMTIDKNNIANYDEQYVPIKTVNGSVTIK